MDASPIFIMTGTPAAGKSTVATALLRRFPVGPHIPIDDLRACARVAYDGHRRFPGA